MRWIAEPDVPNLAPRHFYQRINALTTWLDYSQRLERLERGPSWRAWVEGKWAPWSNYASL